MMKNLSNFEYCIIFLGVKFENNSFKIKSFEIRVEFQNDHDVQE